jgi:recombination protein RecA
MFTVRAIARASQRCFATAASPSSSSRQGALLAAIRQIEAAHGKGSLMQLGQASISAVDVIPTGSLALDTALGIGGLPRGRIVEVYGAESSGKTTVALQVVAEAQKMGLTCFFCDAEHAIDPAYASALGINLDALYLSQPDNGEQALEIVDTMVRSGGVDVVVVDSVAALVPKAELEGEMGDSHMALQARLMSQALRKLTASLAKSHCLIIFINQIRSKVRFVMSSPFENGGRQHPFTHTPTPPHIYFYSLFLPNYFSRLA